MINSMAAMTVSDKIVEGRRRILTCLAQKGAEDDAVSLLELQKQYFLEFDQYLNKEELRRLFSKTHIKQVFETFMPKDVEMTTDIEQTGSLYLKLLRPLKVALADTPFHQLRSTLQKAEKKPNLIPLPMTKPKFNAPIVSASINRTEEILSLDNDLQVKTDMWSAQYNMGSGSKTEDEQAKKEKNRRAIVDDLLSSNSEDDLKKGVENDDEDESSQFGDEALDEGNKILSSDRANLRKEMGSRQQMKSTNSVGMRAASHADKYKLEVMKMRKEEKDEQMSKDLLHGTTGSDDENRQYEETMERLRKKESNRAAAQRQSVENSIAHFHLAQNQSTASSINKKVVPRAAYATDLMLSSDEDDDEEEPLIIMTEEQQKPGKNKKATANSTPEEMHDTLAEQFYKDMTTTDVSAASSKTLSGNAVSMPESVRYHLMAIIPILVQLEVSVKGSDLHKKLQSASMLPYRTSFKSPTDLLTFVRQNCSSLVQVIELVDNDFLLIWKKRSEGKEQKQGLDYLLQKVGKSLEQQQQL